MNGTEQIQDFQVATNWTPNRTSPAATDILTFNNSALNTIAYNVPAQTLTAINVFVTTNVKFYGAAAVTLTLTGDFINSSIFVTTGSSLVFCASAAANAFTVNIPNAGQGYISGNVSMLSNSGSAAHRFQSLNASSVVIADGGSFTFGPNVSGSPFGTGSAPSGLNSIVFQSGSRYIAKGGANPFGASTPNTVPVFQAGSTIEQQTTSGLSLSGRTMANLEINAPGQTFSVTGAGTCTMNNLTVTDGTMNFNLTGRINLRGNISVASGKTLTFTPASSDSLFLNGTSQQSISGAGTLTFASNSKVIINNSTNILLYRDVTFLGELNMKAGNILSDNYLTDPVRTVTIGSSPSSTGTLVRTGGAIIAWVTRYFPASVSGSPVLFPSGFSQGSGGLPAYYKPLTISFTSAPATGGSLTVRCYYPNLPISQDPPEGGMEITPLNDGGFTVNKVGMMYWETVVSGITGGTYDISVDANGQNGITDPSLLRVVYSPIEFDSFSMIGTHASGSGTVANRTNISGNTFGFFYAGGNETNNPLPVELDNFVATTIKNEVILDWATGHELNNTGFDIQRASLNISQIETDLTSSLAYETVGFVRSHGNSNMNQLYKFNDKNLQPGKYAYRLKQIDVNGNHTYYLLNNEVFVNMPGKFVVSQNYPNPFNPVTKINYEMPFDGIVNITVFDNLGREVKTLVNGNVSAGYYKAEFNGAGLSSGLYFYKVNAVSGTQKFEKVFKMMLIK